MPICPVFQLLQLTFLGITFAIECFAKDDAHGDELVYLDDNTLSVRKYRITR